MASTSPGQGAFTREEAAAHLKISTRLLDNLLADKVIPKLKIGRRTLIRVCDLESYLARLARAAE